MLYAPIYTPSDNAYPSRTVPRDYHTWLAPSRHEAFLPLGWPLALCCWASIYQRTFVCGKVISYLDAYFEPPCALSGLSLTASLIVSTAVPWTDIMKAPSQRPCYLHSISNSDISNPIRYCPHFDDNLLRFLLALSSLALLFPKITDPDATRYHLTLVTGRKEKKSWFKETRAPVTPAVNTGFHLKWLPQPLHAKESPLTSRLSWQSGP